MFDYFVSLGYYCGVPMAMEKYGLRSSSGPFDWYFSSFSSVIRTIEEEFRNFLKYENLMPSTEEKNLFLDTVYSFYYVHELAPNEELSVKYPAIREKYIRRIDTFAHMLQRPTCCIRAIRDEEEIAFIIQNEARIRALFKKYNIQNEVVFLLPDRLKMASLPFAPVYLANNFNDPHPEALRAIFDSNPAFINWCITNSNPTIRERNLHFYENRELQP